MFNWIKGCIAIVLVSLSVQVFGQCIGCPPLSGGSVPVPQGSFNGQTSSVTTYNGATPTCYSPTSGGLNGHLQGINNSLCNLRGRLDSLALSGNDSLIAILQGEIDSVAGLIQYYNVISSDSSVIVTRDTVNGVIEFDLSVPQITVNVDATCLGIYTNDLDSILQALIDLNCTGELADFSRLFTLINTPIEDTATVFYLSITKSSDTTKRQDVVIPIGTDNEVGLKILSVFIEDVVIDTASISITAYPILGVGQTYATNSFKIQKITFADISAGVVSGSSYNPNLGVQSNTFSLTTGKNTFKVSVEDTDGNIAYSIFQVTKTP